MNKINVLPLYDNIKDGDYFEPIKLLSKQFKNIKYFKTLLDKKKVNEYVLLMYILCRKDIRICITNNKNNSLEKKSIYYKKLSLKNPNQKNNFAILLSFFDKNKYNDIIKKINKNIIHIFFCNHTISNNKKLDIIFVTKNFFETVIHSKFLLDKLAIKYLKYQNLKNSLKLKNSIKNYTDFVNYVYNKLSLLEIETLFLCSGIVSFYFGLREFTDFDIFLLDYNKSNDIHKILTKSNFDIDIYSDNKKIKTKYIKSLFVDKIFHDAMKNIDNINNYDDIFFNPKCYINFFGIKIVNVKYNIYWRYVRGRPSSLSELIAYIIKLKINVPLFRIPRVNYLTPYLIEKNKNNNSKDVKRSYREYTYLKKILNSNKYKNKYKILKVNVKENVFINTIKFYLLTKYGIKMDKNKIKDLINKNIKSIEKIKDIIL